MACWTRIPTAAAACCALLAATASPAVASDTERRVLAEVNSFRAAHGVDPVRTSFSLARSAGRYGEHILRTNRPHHHRYVWASRRFRLAGENIAWEHGNQRDAARVVQLWASSAAHRRVMLDRRFRWGGVGREYGRLGRPAATVWVLHLGRK